MYASSNRKERRRNAKAYKQPWELKLMSPPGDDATAGAYFDIINTQWRGASKCGYTLDETTTWPSLVDSLKLYFAPLYDKFEVTTYSGWSPNTRFLFTMQGKVLLVNISFVQAQTYTVTLALQDCILDFNNIEGQLQKKSSSLFQLGLSSWKKSNTGYNNEQRRQLYDHCCVQGHSDDWAQIISGLMPMNGLECNICVAIMNELLYPMLQIFRTLAYMDYAVSKGYQLVQADFVFMLTKEAIADIASLCANHRTAISGFPINTDSSFYDKELLGDRRNFYNVYTPPVRTGFVHWLCKVVLESSLDLDAITTCSREHYFYVDARGNPLKGTGYEEEQAARWLVTGTGLHDSVDNYPMFGFYMREQSGKWFFICFNTILGISSLIEDSEVDGFSLDTWTPILTKSFVLKGKGLRDELDLEEHDILENVQYYRCSNEFLECLHESSNIKTLDQANFYIDGFIRMLRRRNAKSMANSCFNTGFIDKEEQYVWLCIPNINGKLSAIQPDVVKMPDTPYDVDGDFHFYKNVSDLMYKGTQIYVDENSLTHISDDREFRIPTNLASTSTTQLIEWIRDSIGHALEMLKGNPFYAQPCYSIRLDRICYLIPLYSWHSYNLEHLAGALFVHKGHVKTIYTVDMARDHACLFNIPKAVWLPD